MYLLFCVAPPYNVSLIDSCASHQPLRCTPLQSFTMHHLICILGARTTPCCFSPVPPGSPSFAPLHLHTISLSFKPLHLRFPAVYRVYQVMLRKEMVWGASHSTFYMFLHLHGAWCLFSVRSNTIWVAPDTPHSASLT